MDAVGPLFAAGIDWLEALLPFLFVAFWVISQVVNLIRRVAGDGGRPQGRVPVAPRRPVAGEPAADARDQLERQIEAFLREARGGQPPAARAERASPPPLPKPTRKPQVRTPAAAPTRRLSPAGSARPEATVAERHLRPLGEAGDDVEEHVRDAFAQDLGHRSSSISAGSSAGAPADAAPAGSDLVATLRDPAALRRLVIMREILDRPIDRWE